MGNEGSMLSGLELDSKPLENTDEWTLHSATSTCNGSPTLSVFCARQSHDHLSNNSLENAIKNLRIYRHPSILKYISSWTHQGQLCMATESVSPLSSALGTQTVLEICLGLHDILKALIFLHEKALCSHNNVCCAAIYVTSDGSWKLGGLEFLSRLADTTPDALQKKRAQRYEKAVPPEEDSRKSFDPNTIDTFAYGVLVDDVFRRVPDDIQVPGIKEFREMSRKQLQSPEPSLRPKLSQLLTQPLFNHTFVVVHDFLSELPLKSDVEKSTFFRGLVDQLREFPEVLLASQLSALLLSRLVLLDKTAQEHLLPMILQPQNSSELISNQPLFSMTIFQQYIVPRLLHMFSVRDAQVRLLLLEHFEHYCTAFTKEQLCSKVLPELLVGIKDTSDTIVASTLRALALLVPILGAATVIGGKRAKLFTDGRPKQHGFAPIQSPALTQTERDRPQNKERPKSSVVQEVSAPLSLVELPERPSPDGGEDLTSAAQLDEETDNWSDWDLNDSQASNGFEEGAEPSLPIPVSSAATTAVTLAGSLKAPLSLAQSSVILASAKAKLPDITSLDIKNSVVPKKKQSAPEEIDFFQDMEPIIAKPKLLHFDDVEDFVETSATKTNSCFDVDVSATTMADNEAWGDNEDWGDLSDPDLPHS
ncbi:protein-associating with the carboxyl-terminal domain of ezrin [Thrips palmi]|uniref:Protein-associating with the carboxyl-terminal domain of ezrin n=1 Tax=Thrips palmi TaxID=161013 RepID=A0A6P8ZV36_THRPL|nr:protein-associating with the carboxyl-terminal domain of ezrin [Thrips palmi]XP_034249178.1 protein-associating with the carboxyl-terminal domain of ezrin [Thrips palmi]